MDGARIDGPTRAIRIIAAMLVVAMLYLAQDVLKPAALAILFAFVLHPLVLRLTRLGLSHAVAAVITVILAAAVAGGVGYLVGRQFVDLTQQLPGYQQNLEAKVRSLRSTGGTFRRLSHTIDDLKNEMATSQPTTNATVAATDQPGAKTPPPTQPVQVQLVDSGPNYVELAMTYVPSILGTVGTGAIVFVLLIFLLLHSEDIRARLIWVAGMRQVSLTTATLDDAGQRIGGYLRMLSIVNFTYGVAISLCLWGIGLPTPLFWGAMAGVLRFVPFLGPWIAAILPTILAIAVFETWTGPLEIIAAFVVVEVLTNMLLEPWLYGKSTGISSLGVVIAAVFWAWLWGPVGLILSVPLTVCLLVIGKQVPQLAMLNHLFGENVEMPKPLRLYQRVLVGDDLSADKIIDAELKQDPFSKVCETLFMPVLQELKRDLESGMIDIAQARRAMTILDVAAIAENPPFTENHPPLLFVAAQNEIDDLAATLLARAAQSEGVEAETLSSRALASEVVAHARDLHATALCLVQVAPISWTHCRHLSKTLSSRLPNATIYAVNIEPADVEAPFTAGTVHLPAKKLYRDVGSIMDRVREMRFVEPKKPAVEAGST